ncbi:superoxide dismutase family protein [uncultured Mycolicibacterium sp.]|uniref:superoxide dismutase[Cu-Zn] n=1 Tax=uncultured Mycolicibacterium sp. TaxID=2320817 RepID=UPI00260F25D6|nr:superoxide dismutase family protein [uncultured Mycolicibacterium sp.]
MLKPLTVAAMFAVPAIALSGCSAHQDSDVEGTTPPVWTGSPAPSAEAEHGDHHGAGKKLSTRLRTADGTEVAVADIEFNDGGYATVTVRTTKSGVLTPGFHGLHIHQYGKCEPNSLAPSGGTPGNFNSAGGHLHTAGDGDAHGHRSAGDLTSLQVREDGSALLVTTTDALTIEDLTGPDGSAIVIHERPDNFANIPPERYQQINGAPAPDQTTLDTGDAGSRVACGVISAG